MIIDPWWYYLICFAIGLVVGGILMTTLIARDPAVVKLEEGMIVTSRDFMEKLQNEILELKKRAGF